VGQAPLREIVFLSGNYIYFASFLIFSSSVFALRDEVPTVYLAITQFLNLGEFQSLVLFGLTQTIIIADLCAAVYLTFIVVYVTQTSIYFWIRQSW